MTQLFYEILHSLEEDGLLDLSNAVHLFCAHYVFVPRLAEALCAFTGGWDNHSLGSEGGLTPNQLWVMGQMQNPCDLAGLLKLSSLQRQSAVNQF